MKVQFISALLAITAFAQNKSKLKFNPDGKIKIMQITDLHLGDSEERDQQGLAAMKAVLDFEHPDFIVNTGDTVSGYMWDGVESPWTAPLWHKFANSLQEWGYKWASTAGNHDSEGDLTREEVHQLDMTYDNCYTQPEADDLTHSFNYMLPIYDENEENIAFRLWFLDTGSEMDCMGVQGFDCVYPDQIDWFREENFKIPMDDPSKGHGMLFLHIPLVEYATLNNDYKYHGTMGEGTGCQAVNTGLYAVMREQPTVNKVTCGHDHNNDFWGDFNGIDLGYGRKIGYGSYGPDGMEKGARVFEVTREPFNIETYVITESGQRDYQSLASYRAIDTNAQTQCKGMDSKVKFMMRDPDESLFIKGYYMRRPDLRSRIPQEYFYP